MEFENDGPLLAWVCDECHVAGYYPLFEACECKANWTGWGRYFQGSRDKQARNIVGDSVDGERPPVASGYLDALECRLVHWCRYENYLRWCEIIVRLTSDIHGNGFRSSQPGDAEFSSALSDGAVNFQVKCHCGKNLPGRIFVNVCVENAANQAGVVRRGDFKILKTDRIVACTQRNGGLQGGLVTG